MSRQDVIHSSEQVEWHITVILDNDPVMARSIRQEMIPAAFARAEQWEQDMKFQQADDSVRASFLGDMLRGLVERVCEPAREGSGMAQELLGWAIRSADWRMIGASYISEARLQGEVPA